MIWLESLMPSTPISRGTEMVKDGPSSADRLPSSMETSTAVMRTNSVTVRQSPAL